MNETDWEQRVSDAWASMDQRSEADFLALIGNLAAELPPDTGVGIFERASSLDSTGHSDLALPLYRQARGRADRGAAAPGGDPTGQLVAEPRPAGGERRAAHV